MSRRAERRRELATFAWVGLAVYIFVVDIYLLLTGRKTMTEVWEESLRHPGRKWVIIIMWTLTTKHLFVRWLVPWLDPFGIIAGVAIVIKKFINVGDKNDTRHELANLARFNTTPFPSGTGDS